MTLAPEQILTGHFYKHRGEIAQVTAIDHDMSPSDDKYSITMVTKRGHITLHDRNARPEALSALERDVPSKIKPDTWVNIQGSCYQITHVTPMKAEILGQAEPKEYFALSMRYIDENGRPVNVFPIEYNPTLVKLASPKGYADQVERLAVWQKAQNSRHGSHIGNTQPIKIKGLMVLHISHSVLTPVRRGLVPAG